MKKTIMLIITLISILSFAISATALQIGAIDTTNGTIEIWVDTDTEFMGFQFDLEGVELNCDGTEEDQCNGGLAEEFGWSVYASGNTALGFSLEGNIIPAGSSGLLTILAGTVTGDICLPFIEDVGPEDDTPIFASPDGEALIDLSIESGGCDSLESDIDIPFTLFNTYPNPFNPELNIDISIEQIGNLTVSIFNLNGQHIHTVYNEMASPNKLYNLKWDASHMSSGVYIVKVDAPDMQYSKIVNLLK